MFLLENRKKKKKVNYLYIIGVTILIAIIAIYLLVSLIVPSFSMVYVKPAQYETVYQKITSEAYIVRNESYVTNDNGGVTYYNVDDTGKIEKNGVIATIYDNESDAINIAKINKLSTQIENLQKLNALSQVTGASLEAVNKSINRNMESFIKSVDNNDFTSASKSMDVLTYSINERQVIVGEVSNFDEYTKELTQKKEALLKSTSNATGTIKSPVAGTFTSYIDGYEPMFSFKDAKKMNYTQLKELKEKQPQNIPDNAIGKIISDVNWLMCCSMSAKEAEVFENIDDLVEVEIPYASYDKLSAKVVTVNKDNNGNAVVVLQCKEMNSTLSKIRKEEVQVIVKSYSGVKVDKSAIHRDTVSKTVENDNGISKTEEKQVEGVYILYGNELRFREISKLYETNEYVICNIDENNEKLFSGKTIKLYDQIVTEGTDLYAGKIVRQSAENS